MHVCLYHFLQMYSSSRRVALQQGGELLRPGAGLPSELVPGWLGGPAAVRWLKHFTRPSRRPLAGVVQPSGTGGAAIQVQQVQKPTGDTMHSVLTSNGSPYQNFQGRIM